MLIVEDPCHKPKIRRRNDHRRYSGSSYPVASANAIAIAMEGGVVVATRTETSAAVEETQTPCHALVFEKAKLDHNLLTADYYDHVHMRILDASMLAIPSNNRNDGVSQSQNEDQHEDNDNNNDNNNVNTHNTQQCTKKNGIGPSGQNCRVLRHLHAALHQSLYKSGKGNSQCDPSNYQPSAIANIVNKQIHLEPAPVDEYDDEYKYEYDDFLITVRNPLR